MYRGGLDSARVLYEHLATEGGLNAEQNELLRTKMDALRARQAEQAAGAAPPPCPAA